METNENQLASYFHHHPHHQSISPTPTPTTTIPASTTTSAPQSNGLLDNADGSHHMLYPHSVPSVVSVSSELQVEPPAKRKRGRPRKYGSPEQALAAKKASATTSSQSFASNNDNSSKPQPPPSASKRSSPHSFSIGIAGQGFTPHVISVAAGEDVGQKVMMFMQHSKREICILSASGSISNASLCQPASSGGSVTYEGDFEILSLTGSYVRNENGDRSGGLSVCLSTGDGQIVGGGVGGPLQAAGPVQVIVGTFLIDHKKDASAGPKGDVSGSKLTRPPDGESVSSLGFRPAVDSSSGNPVQGNDGYQAIGGSHFMIQQSGAHETPSRSLDWGGHPGSSNTAFDLTGRTGHGAHQFPENGDYE